LARKFNSGRDQVFDGERTKQTIHEYIILRRKDGELSREEAREEWDLVDDLDGDDGETAFREWLEATSMGDPWELAVHDYEPLVYHFVDNVIHGWLVPL